VNLSAVLKFLGLSNSQQCELRNIRLDSRSVQAGDLFVAMPGTKVDGREYIKIAIANGAAAVLAATPYSIPSQDVPIIEVIDLRQRLPSLAAFFYNNPANSLKVIGVTGTNGKTSTSHYIAQILNATQNICGVMGTIGNGLLDALHTSELTTSDPCTVQRELFNLTEQSATHVAMEVSSHALVQQRLLGISFNTAVFTNLTQDHLDYHKNMQDYFNAKALLFTGYPLQNAVINLDDAYAPQLLNLIPAGVNVITYSCSSEQADIYLLDDVLVTPWGNGRFVTNLLGSFNKSNVLASVAVCGLQGVIFSQLLQAVRDLKAVPGRMQLVPNTIVDAPQIVVDYAHTPDAIIKALQALRAHVEGKLYCIVGCGGDRDRAKRPLMLQAAFENSDYVVVTQDNPRTEDPQQIINDMLHGLPSHSKLEIEMDRARAIQNTINKAEAQDFILIAGKGHEDYQIIGTEKLPFSDVQVAQQALLKRSRIA
jgi:UDP-N-acetylmuramoyl-L-alanyl-D-glutamate--2,6-diaminopimelate ligase